MMLKRLNDALPGLVFGIVLYGILVELIGVWFVDDKIGYSIGLWYGIAIAIGMAINLAVVIYDSVTLDGTKGASRRIIAKSLRRYVVVVILFVILGCLKFGNLFAAIVGVFGLKISAYAQPLLTKIADKLLGRSDASDEEQEELSFSSEISLNEESLTEESLTEEEIFPAGQKINEEVTM